MVNEQKGNLVLNPYFQVPKSSTFTKLVWIGLRSFNKTRLSQYFDKFVCNYNTLSPYVFTSFEQILY